MFSLLVLLSFALRIVIGPFYRPLFSFSFRFGYWFLNALRRPHNSTSRYLERKKGASLNYRILFSFFPPFQFSVKYTRIVIHLHPRNGKFVNELTTFWFNYFSRLRRPCGGGGRRGEGKVKSDNDLRLIFSALRSALTYTYTFFR